MKLKILAVLLLLSPCAFAGGPDWPVTDKPENWLLPEGGYQISLDGSYLFSTSNFDNTGFQYTPAGMLNIKAYPMRLHAGFGFSPSWSIFGQFSTNNVTATNSNGIASTNIFGLGDGFLATRINLFKQKYWEALSELAWTFPLYGSQSGGRPPLGDQTNDLSAMLRASVMPLNWLRLSTGIGYTLRTAGLSNELPYFFRGDARMPSEKLNFLSTFLEYKITSSLKTDATTITGSRLNLIPGGSLLYKGVNSSKNLFGGGIGANLDKQKEWEIVGSIHTTFYGEYTAKSNIYSLGIAYRPNVNTHTTYKEETDDREITNPDEESPKHMAVSKRPFKASNVFEYDQSARVEKASSKGNFLKISSGKVSGIRVGDQFHIFPPNTNETSDAIALAEVVALRGNTAFLKVKELLGTRERINEGSLAKRIIVNEE